MDKLLVYTDGDLDGAQSALIIKWLYGARYDIEYREMVNMDVWAGELRGIDLSVYKKVFILDKHVPLEHVALVDKPNVVIIDHHLSHFEVRDQYKVAKVLVEVDTSNAKHMYELFKSELKLTPTQERLITLVDDYDNYTLVHKDSLKLHIIHQAYNRPKVVNYINNWSEGFREYTDHERGAIAIYTGKYTAAIKNTQYFYGTIKGNVVISFVGDFAPNEVADFALKRYNAAVCIIVYPQAQRVSFRKSRNCTVDLSKWAEKLAEGGGHEYAAGGKLTDAMMQLTKTFTLCL